MTTLIPFTCCILFLSMDTDTTPPYSLYPTLPLSALCVERHTLWPGYMQPPPCNISVSRTTSHTAASVTFERAFPAPYCPISPSWLLCVCCWPCGWLLTVSSLRSPHVLDCWNPGRCFCSGQIYPFIFCVCIF